MLGDLVVSVTACAAPERGVLSLRLWGASGAAAAAGRGRDMTWLKVVHTGWAAEAVGGLTQVVGGGDGAAAGAV